MRLPERKGESEEIADEGIISSAEDCRGGTDHETLFLQS